MKVIMVSQKFPHYHPRKGEPTFFVPKILQATEAIGFSPWPPKVHTIRKGERWRPGETASIRVWEDLPYRSKQLEIAVVEIQSIWQIRIEGFVIWIDGKDFSKHRDDYMVKLLAENDGLSLEDFWDWFP